MGGTGGHFLTGFLIDARNNTLDTASLSKNGNAHLTNRDIPNCQLSIIDSDKQKIDYVLASIVSETSKPPYFVPLHVLDISFCVDNFDKTIRITYNSNDILELSTIFLAKNLIDTAELDPSLYESKLREREYFLRSRLEFFKSITNPNVLNVSWKELFKGDVELLVNKLSTYTCIPSENFNLQNLKIWRSLTEQCSSVVNS